MFTLDELIEAAEREVRLRQRVYANRVLTHRMSRAFADRQIALMKAIADHLKKEASHAGHDGEVTTADRVGSLGI